jgi:hypothetical protein
MSTQARATSETMRRLAGAAILQLAPGIENGGRNALTIASLLQRAGARPIIAGRSGKLAEEWRMAGGEWLTLDHDSVNPLKLRRNAARLEKFIARERMDIVHAYNAGAAWSALAATEKLPVWLVTNLPETIPARRSFARFTRLARARRSCDRAFLVHRGADDRALRYSARTRHGRALSDRCEIIRSGNHAAGRALALRKAWKIPEGDRIILVPGPIAASAGQSVLVDAVRLLSRGPSSQHHIRAARRHKSRTPICSRTDETYRGLRSRGEIQIARTLSRLAGRACRVGYRGDAGDAAADFRPADSGIAAMARPSSHRPSVYCRRIFWRRRACR